MKQANKAAAPAVDRSNNTVMQARVDAVKAQVATARKQVEALPESPEKTQLMVRVERQEDDLADITRLMIAQNQAAAASGKALPWPGQPEAYETVRRALLNQDTAPDRQRSVPIIGELVKPQKAVKAKGGSIMESIAKGEL